jgi:hypothetical protein
MTFKGILYSIAFREYHLVLKHIFNRTDAAIFLQSFWIIGILVLFCNISSSTESILVPSTITICRQSDSQSLDIIYIKSSNQDYNLILSAGFRSSKVTLTCQQISHSVKQYLAASWKKTLNTLNRAKFVFDSRLQPAFLLLDKPPPSNPI